MAGGRMPGVGVDWVELGLEWAWTGVDLDWSGLGLEWAWK